MATFADHLTKGVFASRPAANAVPAGALYSATDTGVVYQSDGVSTWSTFSSHVPTAGGTFSGDIVVPDEAYDATNWNGSLEVPTKNAVRDKIETLGAGSSVVVQVVNTQTGAASTTSTQIPTDDTIPQSTEGAQFMSLAITPGNASNRLVIDVVCYGSVSVSSAWMTVALFQDSGSNALACLASFEGTATAPQSVAFRHYMTAGTTSATTFKVRAGPNGGTLTFNGQSGSRSFGGVLVSSITITELTP